MGKKKKKEKKEKKSIDIPIKQRNHIKLSESKKENNIAIPEEEP